VTGCFGIDPTGGFAIEPTGGFGIEPTGGFAIEPHPNRMTSGPRVTASMFAP
jgi:hypothetical protein